MLDFYYQYNLSYFFCIAIVLAGLIYVQVRRSSRLPVTLHPFSKEETLPVRGVLALLVIICHICAARPEIGNFAWELGLYIGGPAVGLFFFMSGYGLTVSAKNKGQKYVTSFLRKDLRKLVPPLLLVALLSLAIFWPIKGQSYIGELTRGGRLYPPTDYSWFVYVLLIFYVAFYVVYRFLRKTPQAIRLAALLLVTGALYWYLREKEYEDFWYRSLFAFNVGNLYASYKTLVKAYITRHKAGVLLILLGVLGALAALKTKTLAYTFMPLAGVAFVLVFGGGKNSKVLNFLGRISYETYLMHGIFVPLYHSIDSLDWFGLFLAVEASTLPTAWLLHRLQLKIQKSK